MNTATAVATLDRARARAITRKLAGAADLMLDLVVEAYEGRVWTVLGHDSWPAYVAAEVPALAVIGKGLPIEQRRDAVAVLRTRGLSLRGIAEVLGIAPNTVRTDAGARDVELAEVVGIDGARRAAARATSARRRRRVPLTDRLVELLAAAGPEGLTVREVCERVHESRVEVAPALTRLQRASRVVYLSPARRGLFGRWAAGSVAR